MPRFVPMLLKYDTIDYFEVYTFIHVQYKNNRLNFKANQAKLKLKTKRVTKEADKF